MVRFKTSCVDTTFRGCPKFPSRHSPHLCVVCVWVCVCHLASSNAVCVQSSRSVLLHTDRPACAQHAGCHVPSMSLAPPAPSSQRPSQAQHSTHTHTHVRMRPQGREGGMDWSRRSLAPPASPGRSPFGRQQSSRMAGDAGAVDEWMGPMAWMVGVLHAP